MKYLALDAHVGTSELSVRDARGRETDRRALATTACDLIEAVREVPGQKSLVVEESNLAGWLKRTLEPHVTTFVVCNPKRNNWIAKDEQKDDPLDASKLSHLLFGGYLTSVHHPAEPQQRFKNLVLHYHRMTRSVVRCKNQINAKYREQGLTCTDYDGTVPDALDEIRHAEIEDLYDLLEATQDIQQRAKARLRQKAAQFPQIARFQEVPGIGVIRASTFFAIIDTPFRFPSKAKCWTYCGLGLKTRQSGGRIYRQARNQEFNRHLKSLANQAALSAIRRENRYRDQYLYQLDRGADPRQARVTVARSIISTLWGMWRSGQRYDPAYHA